MRFPYVLLALSSVALAACPNTTGPIIATDGGEVDIGPPGTYDPVQGMPFIGPLLLDDARVMALDPSTLRHGDSPCHAPALVQVIRGVDGDTLHVAGLDGAADTDIRLIGINAPETAHPPDPTPAECYGPEARDFVRMYLSGRWVWLTFGNTRACADPYGRTLAYMFLGGGDRDMVNRQLIQRGYAKKYIFSDDATYETLFTADEAAANAANAGLWGFCPAP